MTFAVRAFAALLLAAAPAAGALAQGADTSRPAAPHPSVLEMRLAVQVHNPEFTDNDEEGGLNIGAEFLTASPQWLGWIWSPRPTAGFSLNTAGDTSAAYAGVTWDFDITGPLFVTAFFGGVVHDGETDPGKPDKRALGCPLLFRESIGLGWRLPGGDAIELAVDHMSNASLCDENDGVENLGLKYHLRF
jgi:lipid A 3-O-deacylase